MQIDARALEDRSGSTDDVDEEGAVRPAPEPGRTVAGQAQGRALVDPGRDVDGQGALLVPPAFAAAVGARGLDELPGALAARAGHRGDHLAEDRLAHPPELAGPLALGTADRRWCPGRAPDPLAGVAVHRGLHLDLSLDPEDRLPEGQAQDHLRVGPGHRAGAAAPARRLPPPPCR